MKILIDTDVYAAFRRTVPEIVERIASSDTVLLSPIVLGELLYGFRSGSRLNRNMVLLKAFLDNDAVELVPVGDVTADRYALIALQLRKQGTPIPANDIWIAAQAMEHGAELLTSDRHFEKVAGLACHIV